MSKISFAKYLMLCSSLLLSISLFAQSKATIQKQLDKIVYNDTDLENDKTSNFIIGIAIEDSTHFFQYQLNPNRTISLDENSIFEISDISQSITAMIVFQQQEKGLLSIQDSLALTNRVNGEYKMVNCTIQEILSHRAGFNFRPDGFGEQENDIENPYADYSKEDLLRQFFELPSAPNPKEFIYSHFGYALLEMYLEEKTGRPYTSLVSDLCESLMLKGTFLDLPSSQEQIPGYNRIGNLMPMSNHPSFAASDGLRSNAFDLIQLAKKSWQNPPKWMTDTYGKSWPMPKTFGVNVSHGWFVHKPKRFEDLIIQSGGSSGHRSFLGFCPATKTAVVVLSDTELSQQGLGYLIIKMLNFDWKHPDGRLSKRRKDK